MQDKVQPLAVPAILEHEAISGLTSGAGANRGRSASTTTTAQVSSPVVMRAMDQLLSQLTTFQRMLTLHGVDREVILQLYKQVCISLHTRIEYCFVFNIDILVALTFLSKLFMRSNKSPTFFFKIKICPTLGKLQPN
jgi:hypothetical protein